MVAILAGRWEVSTVEWKGRWTDILDPAYAAYVRQQLQRAVDVASSGGAAVVLFTAPCYDSGEQFDGAPWPEDQPDRLNAYNTLVRQVVAANPQRATLVNLDGIVCPGGTFEIQIDGVTVRAPDGVHFPFSFDPGNPQTALDTGAQVMWVRRLDRPEALAVDRRRRPQAGEPRFVGLVRSGGADLGCHGAAAAVTNWRCARRASRRSSSLEPTQNVTAAYSHPMTMSMTKCSPV